MNDDFTYTIERFDVSGEQEVLAETVQLVHEPGQLVRVAGGGERTVDPSSDVPTAIANDPVLSEIRANQVTRITATGAAFDDLPFVLRVPGDADDFDATVWSKSLAEEHTVQDWVVQPGRNRVAYVNGSRWCPWPTTDGPRMLPEDWPSVRFTQTWAELSFIENGSMVSGLDCCYLGVITPVAVVGCFLPDTGVDGEVRLALWRRGQDTADDARLFVDWLLDWVVVKCWGFPPEDDLRNLLAQLFVEAALHDRNGKPTYGDELRAGVDSPLMFGSSGTSEWDLTVEIDDATVELALDEIARRSPRLSEIVTAARQPDSPPGKARRVAVEASRRCRTNRG